LRLLRNGRVSARGMATTVAELMDAHPATARRIVIGVSGASGATYAVRLLRALRQAGGIESHLVVSDAGWLNLELETGMERGDVEALAHCLHDVRDVGAAIASGSFRCDGMAIVPCSMRTLAAVAHALADNLITRAADVMLKERRRLVLMVRESPLNLAHLRNMVSATEMGAIVCPPIPAFYLRPQSVEDIVDAAVARVLDLLDVPHDLSSRWQGTQAVCAAA
jgi:4-hydroxy-3-polyprenylbenzoate decarboxylase